MKGCGLLSKQLDSVSQGWLGLKAVVANVILIQEVCKFTLGQHIVVCVPHAVISVLEQKQGDTGLSLSRMLKYQSGLLEEDDVTLKTTYLVNSTMLLSST